MSQTKSGRRRPGEFPGAEAGSSGAKAATPGAKAANPGAPTGAHPTPAIEAVVVAAGAGRRMGGQDKLAAELCGRPVLRWSVEALAAAGVDRIVIVASPGRILDLAAEEWLPDSVVAVVPGGSRRQESVAAGVAALAGMAAPETDPIVLVHDAARPLVSPALIRAVVRATADHGAAIPVLPVTETLKRIDGESVGETVDRTSLAAAQTPQGVRRSLLERAYAAYPPDGPETWTDEASLLEACRIAVHAIPGEQSNLKVTVPADLDRARAILEAELPKRRSSGALSTGLPSSAAAPAAVPAPVGRVGLGTDSHPFGPGEPLVLGGLRIEGVPRLIGHSDGDVALHAVADALLGAAGLGDLGRHFPADSRTPAGVDSRLLLESVAGLVRAAGWRVVNVDMTIVAARPRLATRLPEMADVIATILGLESGAVNVKASTGNLSGPEGEGRSISASAIASIVPLDADEADEADEADQADARAFGSVAAAAGAAAGNLGAAAPEGDA